ncbi:MAG: TfoX/Sxy family DNA transformation protein [Propionibacteriaceae bacterium]|nr:TfoX/Sxy family DNA transformation protein [Micropruina sp.]HBX82172.1 competence protein TfoX [Propionibacteriaceae bacterium]HBY21956.1 competence protein TfoX [Propionibacteriaceae bacterium]
MTSSAPAWAAVRNIGPTTVAQLAAVGVHTPDQLFSLGPAAAYLRLKKAFPERVSKTMLWALAGAELDLDWRHLPIELKAQLEASLQPALAPPDPSPNPAEFAT